MRLWHNPSSLAFTPILPRSSSPWGNWYYLLCAWKLSPELWYCPHNSCYNICLRERTKGYLYYNKSSFQTGLAFPEQMWSRLVSGEGYKHGEGKGLGLWGNSHVVLLPQGEEASRDRSVHCSLGGRSLNLIFRRSPYRSPCQSKTCLNNVSTFANLNALIAPYRPTVGKNMWSVW